MKIGKLSIELETTSSSKTATSMHEVKFVSVWSAD